MFGVDYFAKKVIEYAFLFLYLMKFDIEFMIIKPLRRTHVRIGNG